jgi:hypothetical protein
MWIFISIRIFQRVLDSSGRKVRDKRFPDFAPSNQQCRKHFDWILGFSAEMLVPLQVQGVLHKFAEYAFLREVNSDGHVLNTKVPILIDAVQRAFSGRDLLAHTSVILIHRASAEGPPQFDEYLRSNRTCPWGYPLPRCLFCGNSHLNARVENGLAKVSCLGCRRRTDGPGVARPTDVVPVDEYSEFDDEYYWKPFTTPSPWIGHVWTDIHN